MLKMISVPIADLRKEPIDLASRDFSHNDLRESQLVLGEKVQLIEEHGEWIKIEAIEQEKFHPERGWHFYPGWVHRSELGPYIDMPLLDQSQNTDRLPFSPEQIIADAENFFLGTPYLWGGKAHFSEKPIGGVDCSGLIYMLYRRQNRLIPRDAHDQFLKSQIIHKKDLHPGDLLFFAPSAKQKRITHVALYKNREEYIEAPFTGEYVRCQPLPKDFWETKKDLYFPDRNLSYLVIAGRLV